MVQVEDDAAGPDEDNDLSSRQRAARVPGPQGQGLVGDGTARFSTRLRTPPVGHRTGTGC